MPLMLRASSMPLGLCLGGASPRLLVAEDDDLLRRFLLNGLRVAGFAVVAAADGAEALRLYASQGPFDALLLDDEMPEASGRDVLRTLRSHGDHLPALLFSGSLSLTDEEQAALEVGPVIRKPCGLSALIEALHGALVRASAPDSAERARATSLPFRA